jgi:drug/metabolite transporter (DMT)-like permease
MMSAGRYTSRKIDGNLLALFICAGAALGLGIWTFVQNTLSLPTSSVIWGNLVLQGVLTTAIPIQLMLLGLKDVSALRASILSVTEPLVTVLVGVLMLHEVLLGQQMVGAVVLITSALLIQFQRNL